MVVQKKKIRLFAICVPICVPHIKQDKMCMLNVEKQILWYLPFVCSVLLPIIS